MGLRSKLKYKMQPIFEYHFRWKNLHQDYGSLISIFMDESLYREIRILKFEKIMQYSKDYFEMPLMKKRNTYKIIFKKMK